MKSIHFLEQVLILLRPHQWLKNLFVFLPLFFNGKMLDLDYLASAGLAFVAFCLAASGVYCINDIYDADADRHHPVKRHRPIASGAINKRMAYLLVTSCFVFSFITIDVGNKMLVDSGRPLLLGIIVFYTLINIAYCVRLKQLPIVDVFIIAIGFVLRIFAGGVATNIHLTEWIVLMTFLLALFLAFAKRRDDVVMYDTTGNVVRKNVNRYNLEFMNQTITIVASVTMVCYIMYTVSPDVSERFHSSHIYFTSIFVLAGIIRYMQISIVDLKSGSPTKVLMKDRFVQACVVGWLLSFGIIIYL